MGRHRFTMLAFIAALFVLMATPAADAHLSLAKKAAKTKVCRFAKKGKVVRRACHATVKSTSVKSTSATPAATAPTARPIVSVPDSPQPQTSSAASSSSSGSSASSGGSSSGGGSSAGSSGGGGGGGGGSSVLSGVTGSVTGTTSSGSSARIGMVAGSAPVWELPMLSTLGARRARVEFDIATPASAMASTFDAYARAGVQVLPLASFNGRSPTSAESANLATWAAAYGPGGTFWAAHTYPASLAVSRIEFGNESNQNWQYPQIASDPNWASSSFYATMAQTYARRFHDAATAIAAANPNVALLAIADTPGNWSQWMDNLFAAVPGLANDIGGWVVHPYGPNWATVTDNALAQAHSHGAPDSIPVYATEFGIATDDGRCLSDNYGWNPCLSYAAAGAALTGAVSAMKVRYGSRLKEIDLYSARDLSAPSTSSDRESYFGALTTTGTPKGAFTTAVQALLASSSDARSLRS